MLDENGGSGKDQFLGDPDWLSKISLQGASFSSSMRRKKLEGSGYEIVSESETAVLTDKVEETFVIFKENLQMPNRT